MDILSNTFASLIGDFYASIDFESLPEPVVLKARRVLVDFLATMAVGIKIGPIVPVLSHYFIRTGGIEESTILGIGKKLPAANAAFCMGAIGHSVELDDGHRFGTCHPAAAVIPAALTIGERNQKNFKEVITAIIKGYDAMLRVARSINPSHNPSHLNRGFHTTGTAGAFGSAIACAHLLGMNGLDTTYCLSLAGLQSCGLVEMLHDHPSIKPIQPGRAASAGVMAGDLVILGAKSPRTLFEGKHGWLKAMTDQYSEEALIGELGQRWEILYTYTKLYPTCRHCHPAIDLAIAIRGELINVDLSEIKDINVKTYSVAISEVAEIVVPSNFEEALFSMPFSLAIALREGDVGLHHFSQANLRDESLIKLAKKVHISLDKEMDSNYPLHRGAILQIILNDGKSFEKQNQLPKGEPELPLTDDELFGKISRITSPFYQKVFSKRLWQIVIDSDINQVQYAEIIELFKEVINEK
ncbi:MmgE/PrpD family protein [Candidatus Atribacteria bacterium HGW-Atribacteria-1]|nr:MAG: MmgE/PrpD family protein [Candidatus Atribacteria bacterium HGW-Atribacteria-1]